MKPHHRIDLAQKDDETVELDDSNETKIIDFAQCSKSRQNDTEALRYALVGFWRPSPVEMVCYRQFIVENPELKSR